MCRQIGASRTVLGLFREHGRSSQRREKGAWTLPVQTGGLRSSHSARSTFNHVRRLPHRLEHRELRIVYWSTLITLLRVAHVGRFQNRSFGKDLQLIVVYGSVILALLEGRKPTIARIARYLQLPHETTRRYLKTIVDLGLLIKNSRGYELTERSRKGVIGADKIERLLKRAGRKCPCYDFSSKW